MFPFNLFEEKEASSSDVKKIKSELEDIRDDLIEFNNNSEVDIAIAEMLGRLSAHDTEKLTSKEIVEFLVFLNDKIKTKQDSMQTAYYGTLMRVIDVKIDMLIVYSTAMSRKNVVAQVLSFRTLLPAIITILILSAVIVAVHKYDRDLFVDIGIANQVHTNGDKK